MVRTMQQSDIGLLRLPNEWMEDVYRKYLSANTGPAWVIEDEQGPVAAFGATVYWNGVGEVWFNLIEKRSIITVIRKSKEYLDAKMKEWKVWRLHCFVKEDYKVGRRFVEKMGFQCETPNGMKGYNPDGSTAYLYSKVTTWN